MSFFNFKNSEDKLTEKDIGFVQDAWTFCCHAVNDETHCFESYILTKDEKWLGYLEKARKDRTDILDKITKKNNAQSWCRSKHLAGKFMTAQELCSRYLTRGDKENAKKMADLAQSFYEEFLEINGYLESKLPTN